MVNPRLNNKGELLFLFPPRHFRLSNKKKAGINIDEIMDVTQYACFSSSKQIILLGTKDEHQGIYTYDIDSGKTELLYESKNELINSFELLE